VEQVKTIKSLKLELKELALELKTNKSNTKDLQRNNDYNAGSLQYKSLGLKREFRHKHIAYCLLRGRRYEEIERNCGSNNKPDFDTIREICDAYETKKASEDVRTCA